MEIEEFVEQLHEKIGKYLDERTRRYIMAAEAIILGRGGITKVARNNQASEVTVSHGVKELEQGAGATIWERNRRIRKEGGGRKKAVEVKEGLQEALEKLLEPCSVGDPERELLGSSKSLRILSQELKKEGYELSYETVRQIMEAMGYTLQKNQKTAEGGIRRTGMVRLISLMNGVRHL